MKTDWFLDWFLVVIGLIILAAMFAVGPTLVYGAQLTVYQQKCIDVHGVSVQDDEVTQACVDLKTRHIFFRGPYAWPLHAPRQQ